MKNIPCFIFFFLLFAGITQAKPTDTIIVVHIDMNKKAQLIDNIGASGCWFSEYIGKYWPAEKRDKIADLLFSRKFDKLGNPEGIGLSAWRFNIGAGTTEQGDSSGIRDFRKRTECFLKLDGTYDWNKQQGYQFFLQKAHDYGVETLIGFVNSPPVQFTKNNLGYKTEKDYMSNIRSTEYGAYAKFLADVTKHFDEKGLHLSYLSPVNEPQWDWYHPYKQGDQEGSPWKNEEIYKITKTLDSTLIQAHSSTKILISEAGMLNYLYDGSAGASHQIQQFFKPASALYLGNVKHLSPILGGHSYYTESNDSVLITTRKRLADTAQAYGVNYWQTEYSMLANGYKEGSKDKRTAMDCALFLAKIIHTDLTTGNATAWQFWNSYEPGNADFETRYYLIALNGNPEFKDGEFKATKNLWALGQYSLFVRPGMQRVVTEISNQTNAYKQNVMVSSYIDKNNKLVIVGINYGTSTVKVKLDIRNAKRKYSGMAMYLTTDEKEVNMKALPVQKYSDVVELPARCIATVVLN